ncbi:MAG: hypothetical protein U1C52_00575 [Patescibacteria group bacterium]|nr:hypothetical protein [Patescibacteria group bacterium]
MLSDTVAYLGDIEEVVVGPEVFKGTGPISDFVLYLMGIVSSITNGSGPLARRTGVTVVYPDCGENVVIEVRFPEPMRITMSVEALGVAFTLLKDFMLFPFLRDGERITIRVRKHGRVIDMHARGPVPRAPEQLHQIVGKLRCALSSYLGE